MLNVHDDATRAVAQPAHGPNQFLIFVSVCRAQPKLHGSAELSTISRRNEKNGMLRRVDYKTLSDVKRPSSSPGCLYWTEIINSRGTLFIIVRDANQRRKILNRDAAAIHVYDLPFRPVAQQAA